MIIKDIRRTLPKHKTRSYGRRSKSQITKIAFHHSATTSGSADAFARYHVNTLGWPGIGYHYVVDRDGTINWCNDLETISYQVGGHNATSIGVNLVGNFSIEGPTDAQLKSAIWLLNHLLKTELPHLKISDILGHKEFSNQATACPVISMNDVRTLVAKPVSKPVVNPDPTPTVNKPETPLGSLRFGSQGQAVRELQDQLIALGYDLGRFGADGSFGAATESAVRKFQQEQKLIVDGIAGPVTLVKIEEVLKGRIQKPTEIYRVRKSWADASSQLGAFHALDAAKALADKNPGYSVFTSTGKEIYRSVLIHIVKRGEFLGAIARKYNVTVNEVVAWNKLENANLIYEGQVLKVSKGL